MGAAHKQGTVGHRMTPDVATVGMEATAAEALHLVRGGRHFKITDPVFILDEGEKLVGYLPLVELLRAEGSARVGTIMRKQPASLPPEADEERIAHVALKHGLTAVPVAEKGRLLGAVDSRDVLHILNRSLQEDILHFAGIHKSHLQYENTLAVPLHVTLLHRLPWLVVGLVGIMLLAKIISIFEAVLERHLILAAFIPAIVYMSDALGTQHQTLFVRDLSVLGKEMRLGYYFARQMAVALCVGLVISALVFATVLLAWHEAFIGLIIAASMLIALLVTGFTSLATTLLLHKLGQDPALGSGPFATIVSDITSVVIYFLIASLLL